METEGFYLKNLNNLKEFSESPTFDLFWENSKFNKYNALQLSNKLNEDARISKTIPQLFYPTEELQLKKPNDKLAKILDKRESKRKFSEYELTEKQLGSLFYGFSQKESMTRIIPSAGAKYPVEVYAFLFNVRGPLNKKVVYYNPDFHSLSIVNDCGSFQEVNEHCGLRVEGNPSVLFVFVGFVERVTKKYGERGGRFFLIEVGHYAQTLGLRIAQEKLCGVEVGGIYDDEMKKHLKLENTNALIGLGFACGN